MRLRTPLFAVYIAVALLGLTGAAMRGLATADGLWFGIPAGLAWTVGWSIATFFVLVTYELTRPAPGDGDV